LSSSVLGFGTWEMSTTQYGDIDVGEATRAVHSALDHGITLFDTAEFYGPGHSEVLLGRALGRRRNEATIVTKVGLRFTKDGQWTGEDNSPEHLVSATEGCLRRLDTDRIDLMLVHWSDHRTPVEDKIGALENLRQAGKIRAYGVSNHDVTMMDDWRAHGTLMVNQIGYSMFDRRVEQEVLPYCQAHGIGFMGYGTLAYGLLTGTWTAARTFAPDDWRSGGQAFGLPLFEPENIAREVLVVERLKALAADHGYTVPQLAIAWSLSQPAVSVALVGMRNPAEVAENVQAADWRLAPETKEAVDEAFAAEGVPTNVDAKIAV
jgi:aryl-alcohol dehydrogenase-like predicted oxidoreductase